jgi:hypothetical protein
MCNTRLSPFPFPLSPFQGCQRQSELSSAPTNIALSGNFRTLHHKLKRHASFSKPAAEPKDA